MSEGAVLVTTNDLSLAGALRDAFRGEDYEVRLITADEDLRGEDDVVLLILTGGLADDRSRRLAREARRDLHVPVYGVADDREEGWRRMVRELELAEVFFPPVDPDEVLLLGRTLIERRRLQQITGIVGETEVMREVLERVVQIAPVRSTVLITGESGTGKELVARGLHALSPRRHQAFIAVNVAALSETLLESELFGHEKGAFTGAVDTRKGFFELATGGTIFLDEIGEMPLPTQTKLLRVLEQREFLRVGGEEPIRVDVRIITATNQDLRQLVAIGDFRRDLYYRLNVLHIELPPLRDRPDDIPLLVQAFIDEISRSHDRGFAGISDEAMEILKRYHWPGNVRELRNLVESMVVLSPGHEIQPDDIPDEIRHPESGRMLLPAPLTPGPGQSRREEAETEEEAGSQPYQGRLRPELEFVFRTLMALRMDVDDLRREFDAYRERTREVGPELHHAALPAGGGRYEIEVTPGRGEEEPPRVRVLDAEGEAGAALPEEASAVEADGRGRIVYRPGMTMDEMEREAILAALEEVDGNRRKAADLLGIGERTLYRKIRKYDLEV